MNQLKWSRLAAALSVAAALGAGACSAKVEVGGGDTTTTKAATTTKATATTGSSSDGMDSTGDMSTVGQTMTVGPYTLTVIDASDVLAAAPQGTSADAVQIDEGSQTIARLYSISGDAVPTTDAGVQQYVATVSGSDAVSPITIGGKSGFVATSGTGELVIARASEDGALKVIAGAPGVSQDQLVQAIETVAS